LARASADGDFSFLSAGAAAAAWDARFKLKAIAIRILVFISISVTQRVVVRFGSFSIAAIFSHEMNFVKLNKYEELIHIID
jgi:hypothetical protein